MPKNKKSETEISVDDIYQGEIQPVLKPLTPKRQFKPWHKPRKHFVRINQWCKETQKLLKVLKLKNGNELRYLGLPGEDLLDIRSIKGVCQRAKVKLRYLGFDTDLMSRELNLSRHEVNSDPFIHRSSVVIRDRLEQLISNESQAFQYLERHAPFDVINLDLCDSVTALDGTLMPNLEVIRTLCDVQIKKRLQPWLMFLTTRSIRRDLNAQTRQRLFDRLLQNTSNSSEFSSSMNEKLSFSEEQLRAELQADGTLNIESWLKAYILAISKWLLHYMMNTNYKIAVKMLSSYSYSIQTGHRDMASLAFIFEPALLPHEDDTGLTQPRTQPTSPTEEMHFAQALIARIATTKDIDDEFIANQKLKHKFYEKSAALLKPLRYDMSAYKQFAMAD